MSLPVIFFLSVFFFLKGERKGEGGGENMNESGNIMNLNERHEYGNICLGFENSAVADTQSSRLLWSLCVYV